MHMCIKIYMQYHTWVGPSMGKFTFLISHNMMSAFTPWLITSLFPLHLYLASLRLPLHSP